MHGLRRRNLDDLKHTMGVQVSHYQPNDLGGSSDFSVEQSSRATSQALSP
jgi:hypothetical protein